MFIIKTFVVEMTRSNFGVKMCWSLIGPDRKAREFQKNIYFCFMPKPLTVWVTENYGKFIKRWEYQTT